ncbi:hypothetical protein ACQKTA_13550 (plasmid) [Enterococcus sp. 22-H-5-01]|uniref:hypothetical protein n=1 Tax=Enterococcus sp. 22-H-5-01 TaxID=3418555 RepID=UPI003D02BDC0
MNFKAVDIRKLTFKTTVGNGFKKKDVEDFLKKTATDYEIYDEKIRTAQEEKAELVKEYEEQISRQKHRISILEEANTENVEANKTLINEKQQLQKQLKSLDEVQQLNLNYSEVKKLKRIAENSLSAAENAANRLIDEAKQQKVAIRTEAEDEKNQYLLQAQLEISALVKEQEAKEQGLRDQEVALDKRYQELEEAKQHFQKEISKVTEMVYGVQDELVREYEQEIEQLVEKKKRLSPTSPRNNVSYIAVKEIS